MEGWTEFGKQAVAAALGSGVVLGLFKMFWEQRREDGHRKERARHLALLVAQHLESFVILFTYRLADDFEHWNSDGHSGTKLNEHPRIGPPPASTDYQLLDSGLVDRLYALPLECDEMSNSIAGSLEYVDEDEEEDVTVVRHLFMSRLLVEIFHLAGDLRTHYRLGVRPGTERKAWDRERWLKDHLDLISTRNRELEERRHERNRLNAEHLRAAKP